MCNQLPSTFSVFVRYVSGRTPQLDHIRDSQCLDQTPIVDRHDSVPLKPAFCQLPRHSAHFSDGNLLVKPFAQRFAYLTSVNFG